MNGETDLNKIVEAMEPELNSGKYVFATQLSLDGIPFDTIVGFFKEKEGFTVIIEKSKAEVLGLSYEYVSAWITLNVHSSLDAIGLTALFSDELAKNEIACNVVAGYYHDHIFVDENNAGRAIKVLKDLSKNFG